MKGHCHYWPGKTQQLPPKVDIFHENNISFLKKYFLLSLHLKHTQEDSTTCERRVKPINTAYLSLFLCSHHPNNISSTAALCTEHTDLTKLPMHLGTFSCLRLFRCSSLCLLCVKYSLRNGF
jgi:hypothetical protein